MSIIPTAVPAIPARPWARMRALALMPSRHRRAIQERLDAQDRRATQSGWTITRGRWGSRTYRDPLFDTLDSYSRDAVEAVR